MKWHISSWIFTKLQKIAFSVDTAEKRKFDFFQSLNNVDINLKPRFLAKSSDYIVPSPSTSLVSRYNCNCEWMTLTAI